MSTVLRISRRVFILSAVAGLLLLPVVELTGIQAGVGSRSGEERRRLRFGVISDVHNGLAPDAKKRLKAFIKEMNRKQVDFIVQLGDFTHPAPGKDEEVLKIWEGFKGPRYHVLGNHDMDDTTKPERVKHFGMPASYYSFDRGGWHFVVLDGNFIKDGDTYLDYAKGNYFSMPGRSHMAETEMEWLEKDLENTELQTIVFSHQSLEIPGSLKNQLKVREILESANRRAGFQKVIASFYGHNHVDRHRVIENIHYLGINSAAYYWVGEKYGRMAFYRDPLFATVNLEPEGVILIEGVQSEFVPPSPAERGYPVRPERPITPVISDRKLNFPVLEPVEK